MIKIKTEWLYYLLIFLISFILVFDLFFNIGHSAHMDGRAHITTIAQFYRAIQSGDLKPTWADWFGNYGMPVPLVAHQLVSYLGAWITFITNNVITSWKIVAFIAALLSNLLFYKFLRIHFGQLSSFVAVFIYNVAPYRILNLFVREALPEFFASVFFPMVLIALHYLIKEKKPGAVFLLIISITGLSLSHPMMLVVSSFIIFPYLLYLLKSEKKRLKQLFIVGASSIWGLMIASYYILPLNFEIKYFYYGLLKNHLTEGQTLHLRNFIDPNWYYYFERDILNRGHFVTPGLFEVIITILGLGYILKRFLIDKNKKVDVFMIAVFVGLISLFLTTDYSLVFYKNINILSNIQFPWRMLSLFIFIPPIIIAYFLNKLSRQKLYLAGILLVVFFGVFRFPQLYSKNNTDHPLGRYMFTVVNLHSTNMNTIWTGVTDDYPVKKEKPEIISGEGKIISKKVSNSWRKYIVKAETPIRMVDYTFYFPGWRVWVDGKEVDIQFQDPAFRGVITYNVDKGKHEVYLKFTNTKIRVLGNIISLFSLTGYLGFVILLTKSKHVRHLLVS